MKLVFLLESASGIRFSVNYLANCLHYIKCYNYRHSTCIPHSREQNPADKCCGVSCRQACGLVTLLPAVGMSRQFEASQAATVMMWFAEQL